MCYGVVDHAAIEDVLGIEEFIDTHQNVECFNEVVRGMMKALRNNFAENALCDLRCTGGLQCVN